MKISVIIPARNEAQTLPKLIAHIRETSFDSESEIIVVDGKSTDNTFEVAQSLSDIALRGTLCCRGSQMHEGAIAATGELLVFLHADTRLPFNWQMILKKAWGKQPNLVATAFKVSFDRKTFYFKLMSFFANLRTRWITGVPHGDQAIAINKRAYHSSGGFPDVPIMEEYFLIRKLKKFGKIKILPEQVETSARRYEKNGPFKNNMRNLSLIAMFYLGVSPHRLARFYK